jgi:hypothetical protein
MQKYTSKNTSVNTTKLPAVYSKVHWDKLPPGVRVLDWGCGKDTTLTQQTLVKHGLVHIGYDPHWLSTKHNKVAEKWLGLAGAFVCSNVLNVIDDKDVIRDICYKAAQHKHFFVTVYEGNKSGIGKRSKEDCYQRNEKVKDYLKFFPDSAVHDGLYIKNGVITNSLNMIK